MISSLYHSPKCPSAPKGNLSAGPRGGSLGHSDSSQQPNTSPSNSHTPAHTELHSTPGRLTPWWPAAHTMRLPSGLGGPSSTNPSPLLTWGTEAKCSVCIFKTAPHHLIDLCGRCYLSFSIHVLLLCCLGPGEVSVSGMV